MRTRCLLAVISAALLASCHQPDPPPPPAPPPPTEPMTVVRAADSPVLNELEDDEYSSEVFHAGELVEILKPLPPMKWKARMGEQIAEREGPMADMRKAPGDGIVFGFMIDLGEELQVPKASWICEQVGLDAASAAAAKGPICAKLLRRLRLPSGAIAGFAPCSTGPCAVAVVRDGKVKALAVDGITSAIWVPGGEDGVLLATTRWVRAEGTWTGGTLVPIALAGGAPTRLPDVPTDETDARDAVKVASRDVKVEVTSPGGASTRIHVFGRRREINRADARELATAPIDEQRTIP